ncbi:MAG: hypothetical protein AAF346_11615 [Pseudomonadota bacterium]
MSKSDVKTDILSEDSNGLAVTKAAENQVASVAPITGELTALGATADDAAASMDVDPFVDRNTEQKTAQKSNARHNSRKTASISTEPSSEKAGNVAAVPEPVIIQQQTASTVILTSSQTSGNDVPTSPRSSLVMAGSSHQKPQLPISEIRGYSTSSDVEADIGVAATNDEVVNPALAETKATPIKPKQLKVAALTVAVESSNEQVAAETAVPLPEAKPGREELKRRALAKQRTLRRRAAARRRAALARARAKAAQAQSAPASLLPNWVSSALQIAN